MNENEDEINENEDEMNEMKGGITCSTNCSSSVQVGSCNWILSQEKDLSKRWNHLWCQLWKLGATTGFPYLLDNSVMFILFLLDN